MAVSSVDDADPDDTGIVDRQRRSIIGVVATTLITGGRDEDNEAKGVGDGILFGRRRRRVETFEAVATIVGDAIVAAPSPAHVDDPDLVVEGPGDLLGKSAASG